MKESTSQQIKTYYNILFNMLFWSNKKDSDKQKREAITETTPDDGINEITNALNEALTSKSAYSKNEITKDHQDKSLTNMSLRDIASARAEALELEHFPKEMSCLTAMDELMECMSLGGQVRNYYRYGDFTMCAKQSDKMDFCFNNSLNAGEIKEKNIQEFYKARLIEQLKRGSSEDIWEARK